MADDEDREAENDEAAEGHHDMVAQPHSDEEGPIAEAEILAAEMSSDEQPLGSLGPRFNRRSPFYIGLTASAGVAVTYGAVATSGRHVFPASDAFLRHADRQPAGRRHECDRVADARGARAVALTESWLDRDATAPSGRRRTANVVGPQAGTDPIG